MLLLDHTYFIGDLSLPALNINNNASTPGNGSGVREALNTVGENNLDVFIDKYVIGYLIGMFGRELAIRFMEELNAEIPGKIWTDLKDKLLIKVGNYNLSPLANYVYYWLMRDGITKTTIAGEADPNFDKSNNVSNEHKLIKAWNDMVHMNYEILEWYCANYDDYKPFFGSCSGMDRCNFTTTINRFAL